MSFLSLPRWVFATTVLIAFEASSFQIIQTQVVIPAQVAQNSHKSHSNNRISRYSRTTLSPVSDDPRKSRKNMHLWASDGNYNNDDDSNDLSSNNQKMSNEEIYEGLYEFLTRRTGEQAGESERRRKRDRLFEWMGSGSNSDSSGSTGSASASASVSKGGGRSGASNLVQPILEDGSIMEVEEDLSRTKPKFDKLLSGLPTLDDIISRDTSSNSGSSQPSSDEELQGSKADEGRWFDHEKQKIQADYEKIIADIKEQIQQQRLEDPEAMPENAEGVAESIVRQEMDRMTKSVRTMRAKERLIEDEANRIANLEKKDMSNETDEVVEQILRDASEEWKRKEAVQAEVNDFAKYESEAFQRTTDVAVPAADRNLDAWALERLEEMLKTNVQRNSDDDAAVTDILEQQIGDLRERIEKESKKGSIKPQTMKEWQMYRAIAYRLGQEMGFDPKLDAALNLAELDEEQISLRLKSWRDYIGKEEEARQQAGLSIGTRMPFEWQQPKMVSTDKLEGKGKSKREIRRDVNIQALQAFEELIEKSDPKRAESLQKQLDALREELEPLDYVDVEDESIPEEQASPVDLRDIFEVSEDAPTLSSALYEEERDAIDKVLKADIEDFDQHVISEPIQSNPSEKPNTAFFSDDFDAADDQPPPPQTPFFDKTQSGSDQIDVQNSKLGSAEEQKLLNMYRKAGARTKDEQNAIREQWEAFQELEKSKRKTSGLSDNDDIAIENFDLKYDVSDVLKDDGDFDADKILSTIGPRPTRKKKLADAVVQETIESNADGDSVSDSLFRSVSAIGGGQNAEEPSKDEQKASFEEYLKKEQEMRNNLDTLDVESKRLDSGASISLDDANYAEEVLASIGSRPEKELSDSVDVSTSQADRSVAGDEENNIPNESESVVSESFAPDWLQKERELTQGQSDHDTVSGFPGGNIDEVFDDDAYDHNLRQLHEYEQRRSGQQKQIGIDISDVIGSKTRRSDDYADYSLDTDYFRGRQNTWGEASFEARKSNLLDYVELSIPELNNLMDHRDSVYSSGVSQYLSRVNKPFKEFGAIFRVEGVLLDMTGINQKVWEKVARDFDFKSPLLEEIQQASVTRPDIAVREVFYWSNELRMVEEIVSNFRSTFDAVFDEWAANTGLIELQSKDMNEDVPMALGAEVISIDDSSMPTPSTTITKVESEESRLKRFQDAWTITANELELKLPTNEQIVQSTFMAPDIAVREVFCWTSDPVDISAVVAVFNAIFNEDVDKSRFMLPEMVDDKPDENEGLFLEQQYQAWLKVAEGASLSVPSPEEVLAASVLNDPEAVVVDGFGWTSNPVEAKALALEFRNHLRSFFGNGEEQYHSSVSDEAQPTSTGTGGDLTQEDVLEMQMKAWDIAATEHAFSPPKPDQIQLAMSLNANDAVRRLLGWSSAFNEEQVNAVAATYLAALKTISQDYAEAHGIDIPIAESSNNVLNEYKGKEISSDELYKAIFDAWTNVAWQAGFSLPNQLPDQDTIQFAMTVGPEEAVVVGFQWTDSYEKASELADMYRNQIDLKRKEWIQQGYNLSSSGEVSEEKEDQPLVVVRESVYDWIKSLIDVEMACGVTSYLDKRQVHLLLQYAGLLELFPPKTHVSMSNRYDRDSQQMLGVALRIERRPDHCVVFDSSPRSSTAAHEVDMRSVAMVGAYPRYELLSADTSAVSFDELTAMNIRRLFGERVYDQPMLDSLQNQPQVTRKTKTAFWDPDD